MAYKTQIKISPDVDAWLKGLKKRWDLQSHNKVLRRLKADMAKNGGRAS